MSAWASVTGNCNTIRRVVDSIKIPRLRHTRLTSGELQHGLLVSEHSVSRGRGMSGPRHICRNGFGFRTIPAAVNGNVSRVHYHVPTKERLVAAVSQRHSVRFLEAGEADVAEESRPRLHLATTRPFRAGRITSAPRIPNQPQSIVQRTPSASGRPSGMKPSTFGITMDDSDFASSVPSFGASPSRLRR